MSKPSDRIMCCYCQFYERPMCTVRPIGKTPYVRRKQKGCAQFVKHKKWEET